MALFESGGGSSAQLLHAEVSGLDALDLPVPSRPSRVATLWAATWPKVLAVASFLFIWQLVVWSGWKPKSVLPGPVTVFNAITDEWDTLWDATVTTVVSGVKGFLVALALGTVIGALVSQIRVLRAAVGSLITGLMTMPSVAWVPLALLLFSNDPRQMVLFVILLGAVPSIANGLITGIDSIPPVLLRAGRVMGAGRWSAFRHVVLPAALPSFVGGLKQGWAFAWRSLLAAEIIATIPGQVSLGGLLHNSQETADAAGAMAVMVMLFVAGVTIDALVFSQADKAIRRRYGLIDEATK